MATALARPRLVSLAAGFTDNETLPVRDTRELVAEMLRSQSGGHATLQYGTTQGDPALRRLTAKRVQALERGRLGAAGGALEDRIVIANGSQQMLYMLSEALCDPGDIVLVEDPTYFVYLGIVQSHGLEARGVRMQPDGLDIQHLQELLDSLKHTGQIQRLKLLYLVSYYQNPTAITTAFQKKAQALKLLRYYERWAGHPIYFLEDAAYRELRFTGPEVKSALALRNCANRVIYLGTYSKPFATGVRVGFGILPLAVFQPVMRIKGNHDFGTSNLLQQLLARALDSGRYDRHLEILRQRYARKAEWMKRGLQRHFPPEVQWQEPQGGLYFWARLPKSIQSGLRAKLFRSALEHEVLYVPGQLCYADDPTRPRPNHEMRLSFGAVSRPTLETGLERLARALGDCRSSQGRGTTSQHKLASDQM